MTAADKLNARFRGLQGGLFSCVTKADVGAKAERLLDAGCDVLGWADPFFPDPSLPESVRQAMQKALDAGLCSHYTLPIGSGALRRAAAEKCARVNGLTVDPDRNVLITPGSDAGLLYAMMPFLSEGDEVLVPDPSYPSNFLNCRLCGAVAVPVPLRAEDGYQPDPAAFRRRLTPRTKMVLITHPNNPTGTVFTPEAWAGLCAFIRENDLMLVCDMAFEDHIFDGRTCVTPAALPGMWERTVTTFSVSKGLGLSGLRVGYMVAADRWMDMFYAAAVNVLGATNTLAQAGAEAALRDPQILPAYTEKLERRRRLIYDILSAVPGVSMQLPQSGILSWVNVGALGTGDEAAAYLLAHANVLVNAGRNYGAQGRDYIRIVHGCIADDARAEAVFRRIAQALSQMGKQA